MPSVAKLMAICIRESENGLFFATSEDEPTFFVSALSLPQLSEAIPLALESMFKDRDQDIAAIPLEKGSHPQRPFAIVPKPMLRQLCEERVPA